MMNANFGRIGFVRIATLMEPQKMKWAESGKIPYGELRWETIRGLDIKFDITRPIFSLQAEASISILGLSMDRIEQIASWGAEATMYKRATLIRVYAGYGDRDEDANLIFEGNIVTAMPTMPPDVWLEIKARTLTSNMMMSFTVDLAQVVEKEINSVDRTMFLFQFANTVLKIAGIDGDFTAWPAEESLKRVTIPIYDKPVTLQELLNDFQQVCLAKNIVYYIMEQANSKPIMVFDTLIHKTGYVPPEERVVKISRETGMVGIPKMKFGEIEVTCLLNGKATRELLYYIDVSSRFAFPGLYNWKGDKTDDVYHALFRVMNIRYRGHLRGNEWYAIFRGQRDWQKGDL